LGKNRQENSFPETVQVSGKLVQIRLKRWVIENLSADGSGPEPEGRRGGGEQ
jgi:hypothetical protein